VLQQCRVYRRLEREHRLQEKRELPLRPISAPKARISKSSARPKKLGSGCRSGLMAAARPVSLNHGGRRKRSLRDFLGLHCDCDSVGLCCEQVSGFQLAEALAQAGCATHHGRGGGGKHRDKGDTRVCFKFKKNG
jgi:hypothetical protein